jgi:phage terminase large subunit GpA-like protein
VTLSPDITHLLPPAGGRVFPWAARALAPRKRLTVSEWADEHRRLSSKGSARPGKWVTDANPPLREPMDALSRHSTAREVVLMFPIQFGKTEVAINWLGYCMDYNPGPVMVCLPGEVSMKKWIDQKLNPAIEESAVMQAALTSTSSRESANRREFKDFAGGQLYLEHAGSPSRLKSTTVRDLTVDELDEFASALIGGDDPVEMLKGRTSAFPTTGRRLYISTPQMKGSSRIEALYDLSDRRRFHVPCPECGHRQPLEWSGLHWSPGGERAWYCCRDCGCCIEEHHKTEMIRRGQWVPENPESRVRGYTINALYYQIGLGPRWPDLVRDFLAAQSDPSKLKVFINDRLAQTWEDPAMRAVKHNVLRDRAEPYRLRVAPHGVLAVTAGVDTQDDRLEVQIVGWGRGLAAWVLDYVVLPGDPANPDVWSDLAALLNRPIEHESGALLSIDATAIDTGGHRGEHVKSFVRAARIRRPMAVFGAVANNAPVLNRGKLVDVKHDNKTDPRGLLLQQVGTVAIKHLLYSRISTDADKQPDARLVHVSDDLPPEFFVGLVSETYNPSRNRFEKRNGARNEPLDTWVYAYAATHHAQLRLHRNTRADWDAREKRLLSAVQVHEKPGPEAAPQVKPPPRSTTPPPRPRRGGFATNW